MPRRPGLTRASVVEAAAKLADAEGLESVTLARLAATLGVKSPSLYNHVDGQDGIRRELALLGMKNLADQMRRATVGKSGEEAVYALAVSSRDFAKAHPGLYAATVRAPEPGDSELEAAARDAVEVVLMVLSGYGLQGDDALHVTRGIRSLVHGFVSLEAAGGFGMPLKLDESFDRMIGTFLAGLRALRE